MCIRDSGSAYAQYLLGKLTLMGEGVPKDMDAAYEWFAAARDNGHAYAEFFLKRMERGEQEPPSVLLSATRLLYHMGNIFRDNAPAPAANGVQIDRKRPVSYTHLDVYKRQILRTSCTGKGPYRL